MSDNNKSFFGMENGRTLIERRRFLKMTGMTVGYFGFPGGAIMGGLLAPRAYADTIPAGIKHMTPYEYQIFQRLVDVCLPVKGTKLPDPAKLPVIKTIDAALLGGMEPHILAGLKKGIQFFDSGPKSSFQNKSFTNLSDGEARAFCDSWANANDPQKRGITMGLKKLVGLAYWSNPNTWPYIGFGGPATIGTSTKALGNAPMPT